MFSSNVLKDSLKSLCYEVRRGMAERKWAEVQAALNQSANELCDSGLDASLHLLSLWIVQRATETVSLGDFLEWLNTVKYHRVIIVVDKLKDQLVSPLVAAFRVQALRAKAREHKFEVLKDGAELLGRRYDENTLFVGVNMEDQLALMNMVSVAQFGGSPVCYLRVCPE